LINSLWIRVFVSFVGALPVSFEFQKLLDLFVPNSLKELIWNFELVKQLSLTYLDSNPFIDSQGREKHILIASDEFSLVIDEIYTNEENNHYEKSHQVKSLFTELNSLEILLCFNAAIFSERISRSFQFT
jgi:hypothetical protein